MTYVEHFLAPTLCQGDIVVMDNLPAHKVAGVTQAYKFLFDLTDGGNWLVDVHASS